MHLSILVSMPTPLDEVGQGGDLTILIIKCPTYPWRRHKSIMLMFLGSSCYYAPTVTLCSENVRGLIDSSGFHLLGGAGGTPQLPPKKVLTITMYNNSSGLTLFFFVHRSKMGIIIWDVGHARTQSIFAYNLPPPPPPPQTKNPR